MDKIKSLILALNWDSLEYMADELDSMRRWPSAKGETDEPPEKSTRKLTARNLNDWAQS